MRFGRRPVIVLVTCLVALAAPGWSRDRLATASEPSITTPTSLNAALTASDPEIRPPVLRLSGPEISPAPLANRSAWIDTIFQQFRNPPVGYTGPSGVAPTEAQTSSHFVPIEDRWRIGSPEWDRYGKGHPITDDYPYMPGSLLNPFTQNVLKGDFPIFGQHTFLDLTGSSTQFYEPRQLPTQTGGFESTARPNQFNFFGRSSSFVLLDFFALSFDLSHGDAAFKPVDWRIKITPTLGVSNFSFSERAQVSPNVLQGASRIRTSWALQDAFLEAKIADVGPDYDFVSIRGGTQPFISDFRGFLFADQNRAVRLFGTRNNNRDQWNLAYFRPWEKDTNTALNTFNDRGQNLLFANYYRQDFLFPGYTAQVSLTYDNDPKSFKFDKNRFWFAPMPWASINGMRSMWPTSASRAMDTSVESI